MSYPYDYNPWDDNYATANQTANRNDQQQSTGYSAGGGEGFRDSMGQYPQSQQYDDNVQQQQPTEYQQQQQQQSEGSFEQPQNQPESFLKRFLRAHIPLCGTLMDNVCSPLHDIVFKYVNRDLLVSKIFYFFFYSAFGSLFPLMGVYFKQLGMNPAQVGILTGVRPFIEIFSAPFWSSLAEKFHQGKALLLFSLASWIIFTYSLAHIRPPASACVAYNDVDFVLYTPYSDNDLRNYDESAINPYQNSELNPNGKEMTSNELYMNRPPNENIEDRSKILASEENENDQGKRRRRRKKRQASFGTTSNSNYRHEQISRPIISRLLPSSSYLVDNEMKDDGYESHLDVDIDLDNDFDDKPIGADASGRESSNLGSLTSFLQPFIRSDTQTAVISPVESDEDDEMEQSYTKLLRLRRNSPASNPDYEPSSDESAADSGQENQEGEEAEGRSRDRDENGGGADDEESEEGSSKDVENDMDDIYGNNNRKSNNFNDKQHQQKRKQQKSQTSTTTTTISPTTTTMAQTPNLMTSESNYDDRNVVNKSKKIYKQRHKTPPTHIVGMSPITVEYAVNYNKTKHGQFVAPMFSTIVYKLDDIKGVFFLLLLLISLGEFFSAPAITIADSITLGYLGENTDHYGRQRMFGSFGWAITLMLVGMALDNSTFIADHPCGPHQRERSYTVCFAIFSMLMAFAFLTATQFRFYYPPTRANGKNGSNNGTSQTLITSTTDSNQVITTTVDGQTMTANVDDMYASTQPRNIFNTAPPVNAPPPGQGGEKEKFEFLDKWKSAVFAQRRSWDLPEWVNVFRQFKTPLNLAYLFITWFLGCGVGLVFTFLFWHLQDVGGTPTLFGICSVINHVSEILAYFFSSTFIKRFGHTKVLSVGLGCNVIRFLYVAFLSNPYYALPFELVQGITHAACFAACCSYISHASKPELRTSTQGVMQGLHHGIGRACGTLIGGYMINAIGSRASFCIYGLLSGLVLAGFLYIRKKTSLLGDDEEVKVENTEALGGYGAPQGVPSAIPGKIAQTVPTQDIDYQW